MRKSICQNLTDVLSYMLHYYYKNKSIVCIQGEGYSLTLDGNEIVNEQNCLSTIIQIAEEKDGISFILNNSNYLPGPVTVCMDNQKKGYLYLFNTRKKKYEQIFVEDCSKLKLSSGGKYLVTQHKLRQINWLVSGLLVFSSVIIVFMGFIYIWIKKKYWFW